MIIVNSKDIFGGITSAISGTNGSYAISGSYAITTAKEGVLQGLSSLIFECSSPPLGGRRCIAKLIYAEHLSKSDRHEIHREIIEFLDKHIDSGINISTILENLLRPLEDGGVLDISIEGFLIN